MYRNNNFNSINDFTNITQKIRCAIYTRKSCEDGLELEYNSLDNQYDTCAKYIQDHEKEGWVLINKRYDDGGFSGGTLDRPALKDLMQDVKLGFVDKIVIYKLDRISRSSINYYKLKEVLEKKNIEIEIATQNFDKNTSTGRFSLNMMLSFAQLERDMASERIAEKIRRQQSLGMWTGGFTPLGYDVIDKKLIVNKAESEIVKFIFNTFINTKSINETLNQLKEKNYKTKTFISQKGVRREGTDFNRGLLYTILKNKIYAGLIENKVIKQISKGQHEAIIDEETLNKVNAIFQENMNLKFYKGDQLNDRNNNTITKSSKMPYLLKGLMHCACCNSTLTPVYTIKKNGVAYRYYKPNKAIKHSAKCRINNIPAQQIENIILNQIYAILKAPSLINTVIEKIVNNSELKITEADIINYFKNIEVVWDELFPKEQVEIVRILIKNIIISETNIKIIFNDNGLYKLLSEVGEFNLTNINTENSNNNQQEFEVNIPVNFKLKSERSFITSPDGKEIKLKYAETKKVNYKNSRDNAVVSALIKAENWKKELMTGSFINISTIVNKENKDSSYIYRILKLIFLAPDIKKSIITGNMPLGLVLKDFYEVVDLTWAEQRKKLKINNTQQFSC